MVSSLRCCAVGILFTLAFSAGHSVAADPPKPDDVQEAQLDAGEFEAALASARKFARRGQSETRSSHKSRLAQNAVGGAGRRRRSRPIFRMTNDQNQATAFESKNGYSACPSQQQSRRKNGKPGGTDADFDSLI